MRSRTLACAAQFMVVLDVSVVNVALPAVRSSLGFSDADLHWVVNAYALAHAGLLLLGGRLGDVLGRRAALVGGVGLFTAASAVGGMADSAALLVAARAAQGLGAAVVTPTTLAIVASGRGAGRTRALAAWTAVATAGGTAGVLVGGLLTETLGWRSTLLVNVPVGVVALWWARGLPRERDGAARVDVLGAVMATTGLGALGYGISRDWVVAAAGAGLIGAFAVWQTRARAPLVPPGVARTRSVAVGNVVVLLAGAALNPMWFYLALAMRDELGLGPLGTGLGLLPHTVLGVVVGVRLTPWLLDRFPARPLVVIGALTAAAGFVWQSALDPGAGYWAGIAGPAVVIALGSGLLNTPLTATALAGVRPADTGAASGLLATAKQTGAGLGLAAIASSTTDYGAAFLAIAAILAAASAGALFLPAAREAEPR
ncbi:MFS transporter [Actinokineospora pegani]|uniref:MFS transporter n=1 Tax=Actinokineospora pegani TaxID=2654637 RepID=UPI001F39DC14|nr:MFS transporter [Actinokineospora pegani]